MIVVTGATGHIGNNLVRALVKRGHRVRCMVLPGESLVPLGGLDVEIVEGDVRDIESLYKAFDGAQLVFHLASIISLLPGNEKLLEEVNVKCEERCRGLSEDWSQAVGVYQHHPRPGRATHRSGY